MSETKAVSGTLESHYQEGNGRCEQAKFLIDQGETFEVCEEYDVYDPNWFYIFGQWYKLANKQEHEPECLVTWRLQEGDSADIDFTAVWHSGGTCLEEILDEAITDDRQI